MKIYQLAPLPFHGQKRHFIKPSIETIKLLEFQKIINKDTFFLDVFGGSGLISNNLRLNFRNRIIYNDFDNYSSEIHKTINTYKFLNLINQILPQRSKSKNSNSLAYYYLNDRQREFILDMIDTFAANIHISTICMYLSCFHITKDLTALKQKKLVNNLPVKIEKIIEKKRRVLKTWNNGIEIISKDFSDLRDYYSQDNCFAIFDPPYRKRTKYCSNYKEYTFFDFNQITFNGIGFVLYGYDEDIGIQDKKYQEYLNIKKNRRINSKGMLNERMSVFVRKDALD